MINVVIGGGEKEKETFHKLYTQVGKPNVMNAKDNNAFVEYCKRSLQSADLIQVKDNYGDAYTEITANDDMIIFLPKEYYQEETTPLLYILATIIEVAMNLGLDIQVYSFVNHNIWNPTLMPWPEHWPSVAHYSIENIG